MGHGPWSRIVQSRRTLRDPRDMLGLAGDYGGAC